MHDANHLCIVQLYNSVIMKTFSYVIKNNSGIHARPAGMIARNADKFVSEITMAKNEKSVNLKKLISIMQLNVICGDTIIVTINGEDEDAAFSNIKSYFEENL